MKKQATAFVICALAAAVLSPLRPSTATASDVNQVAVASPANATNSANATNKTSDAPVGDDVQRLACESIDVAGIDDAATRDAIEATLGC